MSTESQAPAKEVIDFSETMESGVITHVKKEEPTDEAKKAEQEKIVADAAAKKAAEEAKKEESEEEEEEEEEEEDDKLSDEEKEKKAKETEAKAKEKPDDKKKKDEPEDETIDVDDFVKEEYFEKFEVENKKQLDELLETAIEVVSENKKLKKQIEELGDGKPKFADDHEAKAFELVKSFSKLTDGATAFATLIGMDVAEADAKSTLELQYILEHSEVGATKAKEQFDRMYKRKYTVKDKDKFDSVEDFEDAKKDVEFDLENDSAKAKKFLKAKQEEVRTKPQEKPESKEEKVPEVVQKGIERNAADLTKYADGFSELTFSPTDDESDDFTFKLKPEQVKAVKNATLNWVNNPNQYDEKGKFIQTFDPEDILKRSTYAMFGDEVFGGLVDHLNTLVNIKRADQVAKVKSNEKSKSKGDLGNLNEYDQAEHLAKKKKAERQRVSLS